MFLIFSSSSSKSLQSTDATGCDRILVLRAIVMTCPVRTRVHLARSAICATQPESRERRVGHAVRAGSAATATATTIISM